MKTVLKAPQRPVVLIPEEPPTPLSPGLSVLLGAVLFLMLVVLLIFSAGLDASKFIYVDF